METDLYILSIDTLFKNPAHEPLDPLNIKNTLPSTNDPNGVNNGILKFNPNNPNDPTNEVPTPYYHGNAANYMHVLSEPIKNVTGVRLSSIEFPNVNFLFSQAKGSNYFTLVIPKDKQTSIIDDADDEDLYNSSDDDPYQFNKDQTDMEPYRITIVIPDGLYSYTTLIDQIQSTFNNINNSQYVLSNGIKGDFLPGDKDSTKNLNKANYSSYPNATINLSIWYNLVTFKITITNTDLTFNKHLPFGLEFPQPSNPGPSQPYVKYTYENVVQGAYDNSKNDLDNVDIEKEADLSTISKSANHAMAPFLPLPVAVKKNLNTNPFDGTFNKSLGYLLGFRKTVYRVEDCKVQAGSDHQSATVPIILNTIYPNEPSVPIPNTVNKISPQKVYGIPPGSGWVSEAPLDTQGDGYLLLKINDYGNIIHENNPTIYDQPLGYVKDSKGQFVLDINNNLIPIKRRVYSRQQDKYFAKIILVSGKGNLIFDNGSNFVTKNFNFRQPTDINKLHITLHEANGDILNLQGFDYSLTLEFTYIVSSLLKNSLEAGLMTLPKSVSTINDTLMPNPSNEIIVTDVSNKYMLQKEKKKHRKKKFDINY